VKSKVIGDAIKIVSEQAGCPEFDETFEQILPMEDGEFDSYYIWNKA